MAQPSKVILVFCDGTGMDGILGLESVPAGSQEKSVTNVLRLSRAVSKSRAKKGAIPEIPQIVLYQPGVGSQAGFEAADRAIAKLRSGEFGEAYNRAIGLFVASKIREVYTFIAQNYIQGDLICLFGYSRGAYTARKVAGLIDRIGILSREQLYDFKFSKLLEPTFSIEHDEVEVECVGVWDTVGSVRSISGEVIDAYNISDTTLPPNVKHAYHAVSLQENRSFFLPTLWTKPSSTQDLQQVWFLGDHGDVGGGHQSPDLSDISLVWMADRIRGSVDLDPDAIDYYIKRKRAAGWGESQPNNAFLSLPRPLRISPFGTMKRDTIWNKHSDVEVHLSCFKAPDPRRGYEMLRLNSNDLPDLPNRKRAVLDTGAFEDKLRNSRAWKSLDPTLVTKPDTSQDKTAIEFDKSCKAAKEVFSGRVSSVGKLVGGLVKTTFHLAGEVI